MLSRPYRIRKSGDFSKIYHYGFKVHGKFGMLIGYSHDMHSTPNVKNVNQSATVCVIKRKNGLQKFIFSKFGFVVNKKIGSAVARNRMKRWLSNIVLEILGKNFFQNVIIKEPQSAVQLDILYIAFKDPASVNSGFHDLKKECINQVERMLFALYKIHMK